MALGGGVTFSLRFSAELFPWQNAFSQKNNKQKRVEHTYSLMTMDDQQKVEIFFVSYILKWWSSSIFKFPDLQPKLVSPSRPVSSVVKYASTSGCWNTWAIIPAAVTSCTTTTDARGTCRLFCSDIVVWGKIFGWYPKKARRQPKGVAIWSANRTFGIEEGHFSVTILA